MRLLGFEFWLFGILIIKLKGRLIYKLELVGMLYYDIFDIIKFRLFLDYVVLINFIDD